MAFNPDTFQLNWDATQVFLRDFAASRGITLSNVSHNAALSDETVININPDAFGVRAFNVTKSRWSDLGATTCFSARIKIGTKAVAEVSNRGFGGPTDHHSLRGTAGRLMALERDLRAAAAAYAGPADLLGVTLGDLGECLLQPILEMKALRSVIGRTRVGWTTNVKGRYTTVRWPTLNKLWKTHPDRARAQIMAQGRKQGWFTDNEKPTFVNDLVRA